jgi:hypothetical protein
MGRGTTLGDRPRFSIFLGFMPVELLVIGAVLGLKPEK